MRHGSLFDLRHGARGRALRASPPEPNFSFSVLQHTRNTQGSGFAPSAPMSIKLQGHPATGMGSIHIHVRTLAMECKRQKTATVT
jgi:hypothetical protein